MERGELNGEILFYLEFALKCPRKCVNVCVCVSRVGGGQVIRWNQIDKILIIVDEYENLI